MNQPANSATGAELLAQARRFFVDQMLADLSGVLAAVMSTAHELADAPAERAVAQQRWDVVQELMQRLKAWPDEVRLVIDARLQGGQASSTTSAPLATLSPDLALQLVDDETVQRNILESRMALAVLDKTTWEFADLRARLANLSGEPDLDEADLFRPQVLGRCILKAWLQIGLSLDAWKVLESTLHKQWGERAELAFKATNEWLVAHGVVQEVNLRSFIRRVEPKVAPTDAPDAPGGAETDVDGGLDQNPPAAGPQRMPVGDDFVPVQRPAVGGSGGGAVQTTMPAAPVRSARARLGAFITRVLPASLTAAGATATVVPEASVGSASAGLNIAGAGAGAGSQSAGWFTQEPGPVGPDACPPQQTSGDEETRLMTQPGGVDPQAHAQVVLQRFGDLVEQHLPGFRDTASPQARAPSARLSEAMEQAQQRLRAQAQPPLAGASDTAVFGGQAPAGAVQGQELAGLPPTPEQLVQDIKESQKVLKKAAATPGERATIELVALLFQSILGEDQIPSSLRLWFARLQMPTLRVALAEPDFFSSVDHPARKLIDRMGGCVMGFEGAADVLDTPLEAEIKRVVQVVEAFPDTGRRVFQAVLVEFERFLERYYREQHAGARSGVSLAQKIEQRETLAIQYTIELRKLLNDVPVHERVRDFLFHVWADVLATTAVRHGAQSAPVKATSEAATQLVWAASAKLSPAEREEVVRRLPLLLGQLRTGMSAAGLDARRQDEAVQALVPPLQAAFSTASTQVIPGDQLQRLKQQLEAIEEVIPDGDMELDDSWVLDEAAHHYEGLEIVSEGGSMPEPNMLEWAERVEVGAAFVLEYRGRREAVRLVWLGMHRQLSLFLTPQGRCVLFQKMRLAAFLQAGLLVPAQEESLTTAATRKAYTRVARDPQSLEA